MMKDKSNGLIYMRKQIILINMKLTKKGRKVKKWKD